HVVWEPEINVACFIKRFDLLRCQHQFEAREIVLQLRKLAGAYDWNDRNRPRLKPRKRHLSQAAIDLISNRLDGCNDAISSLLLRQEILHHLIAHSSLFAFLIGSPLAVVLASQHATG